MNDYKIKVNNEAESKEAQELFFELGYEWRTCGKKINLWFKTNNHDLCTERGFICATEFFNENAGKEITLPQLRDIVVLKRNKIEDATHECMGDKFLVQENRRYEWTFSGWATSGIAMSKLKPISEQQMASHNIEKQAEQGLNFSDEHMLKVKATQEQQELKANPKLFLDPTQNYAEIEWDGSFMKQNHWVEVPDGAEVAVKPKSGHVVYFFNGKSYFSDIFTPSKWVSLQCDYKGYMDDIDSDVVWQRTQDEPFLTPESVVEREVNSKNVVKKANEFSERLKKLEYQVGTMGSSASGGANLMPRNSVESISIHGAIESKLDLEPQEDALDVQIGGNHYKSMKIQPVEFALANGLDFCQGSAIKYILRHAEKGGKQDLEKAKHFIDLMIQHYYG